MCATSFRLNFLHFFFFSLWLLPIAKMLATLYPLFQCVVFLIFTLISIPSASSRECWTVVLCLFVVHKHKSLFFSPLQHKRVLKSVAKEKGKLVLYYYYSPILTLTRCIRMEIHSHNIRPGTHGMRKTERKVISVMRTRRGHGAGAKRVSQAQTHMPNDSILCAPSHAHAHIRGDAHAHMHSTKYIECHLSLFELTKVINLVLKVFSFRQYRIFLFRLVFTFDSKIGHNTNTTTSTHAHVYDGECGSWKWLNEN